MSAAGNIRRRRGAGRRADDARRLGRDVLEWGPSRRRSREEAVPLHGTCTRRSLLRAVGALGTSTALAACGATPSGRHGAVTLRLLGTGSLAFYQHLLPAFEAAHPGLRVQVSLATAGGTPALTTALLTGSGPDVLWGTDPALYLARPLLLDLAPLVARDHFPLGDFNPTVLDAFRVGQGLFMLPRSLSPLAYATRTDLFSAAGLDLPTAGYTYRDLERLWRVLTVGERIGGQLVWAPAATFYLTGWGADLVDPADPLRAALGSPQAIACGEWMWDRFWKDRSAQGLQGQHPAARFFAGTLAMQTLAAADLANAAGLYANLPWRLTPFPLWPKGAATAAGADFYAISAASAHPEAAWLLLRHLVSVPWEQAGISDLLLPPSRVSLWPQFLAGARRAAPPLRQQPLELFTSAVQGDQVYPPQQFRYQQATAPTLAAAWQRIFGPHYTTGVRAGFPALAKALDVEERAAAGGAPP